MQVTFRKVNGHIIPALNVKVHNFPYLDLQAKYSCSKEQEERIGWFIWEHICEDFWKQAIELAKVRWPDAEVIQDGRMGGWLCVKGLPEYDEEIEMADWPKELREDWSDFEDEVRSLIRSFLQLEYLYNLIEANKWQLEGAERFNFIDRDGTTFCIAELKAQAIAAGFGAVVRN